MSAGTGMPEEMQNSSYLLSTSNGFMKLVIDWTTLLVSSSLGIICDDLNSFCDVFPWLSMSVISIVAW